MMDKIKRTKKVKRATLTISLPDELIKKLKEKPNYSGYIASLVRADFEKEMATPPPPSMSPEEAEIRQALKERDRLRKIYGLKVGDVEYIIRKGGEEVAGKWVPIPNWHLYMEQKGIEDKRGYFKTYAKYNGEHAASEMWELWSDIADKVREEEEKEHELRLKQEVVDGMTLQETMDKLEAYLKRQLDKKVAKIKDEKEKIVVEDALGIMMKTERQKEINRLEERFEAKEVSMKVIVDALGLPYMEVYNKVAPALRREGYSIT